MDENTLNQLNNSITEVFLKMANCTIIYDGEYSLKIKNTDYVPTREELLIIDDLATNVETLNSYIEDTQVKMTDKNGTARYCKFDNNSRPIPTKSYRFNCFARGTPEERKAKIKIFKKNIKAAINSML